MSSIVDLLGGLLEALTSTGRGKRRFDVRRGVEVEPGLTAWGPSIPRDLPPSQRKHDPQERVPRTLDEALDRKEDRPEPPRMRFAALRDVADPAPPSPAPEADGETDR